MIQRYEIECWQCGTIEADTTQDGLFDRPTAERRAGFHEGNTGHDCVVSVVETTPEFRCPVCQSKCVGKDERDQHADGHPGVDPHSFARV